VKLAPDRPRFRQLLAASYQNQGRFTDAESELRTALQQGRSADTLRQLGHVLLYQKREQEAIAPLSEAASLEKKTVFTWLYLGLAYQWAGRTADAQTAFRQGLSVAEKDVVGDPGRGLNHAVLGYFCAQNGQEERAGVEASQAVQLAPHDNDTLWIATLTYERTGNRTAALKTLESAPRLLLEDLRRWPEASALSNDPGFPQLAAVNGGR